MLISGGCWLNGGGSLDYVSTSPKYEKYRLEIHAAKRYQALLNRGTADPGYVLLYDNTQNQLLQQSDIVDLMGNAEVRWSLDALYLPVPLLTGYTLVTNSNTSTPALKINASGWRCTAQNAISAC
ncbi:MAG: hypothetical protein JNM11_01810 [Chitinimonas sp.]|nr:hypothetical protein [Chitinimonas sp.]